MPTLLALAGGRVAAVTVPVVHGIRCGREGRPVCADWRRQREAGSGLGTRRLGEGIHHVAALEHSVPTTGTALSQNARIGEPGDGVARCAFIRAEQAARAVCCEDRVGWQVLEQAEG